MIKKLFLLCLAVAAVQLQAADDKVTTKDCPWLIKKTLILYSLNKKTPLGTEEEIECLYNCDKSTQSDYIRALLSKNIEMYCNKESTRFNFGTCFTINHLLDTLTKSLQENQAQNNFNNVNFWKSS